MNSDKDDDDYFASEYDDDAIASHDQVYSLAEDLTTSLREGSVCYVRRMGDTFDVGIYPTLRQDYPELYGYLLALNQKIVAASGCLWGLIALGLAAGSAAALYEFVPNLGIHGWWAYPLTVLAMFVIWGVGNNSAEARVFARHLEELNRQLARHGIGRYRLIEWLAEDTEVQAVLQRLKENEEPE